LGEGLFIGGGVVHAGSCREFLSRAQSLNGTIEKRKDSQPILSSCRGEEVVRKEFSNGKGKRRKQKKVPGRSLLSDLSILSRLLIRVFQRSRNDRAETKKSTKKCSDAVLHVP